MSAPQSIGSGAARGKGREGDEKGTEGDEKGTEKTGGASGLEPGGRMLSPRMTYRPGEPGRGRADQRKWEIKGHAKLRRPRDGGTPSS